MLGPGGVVVVVGGRMIRMVGGAAGVWEVLALPSFLAWFGGRFTSFPSRSLGWDWRWWGWGGVGLEEGLRSLLARIP